MDVSTIGTRAEKYLRQLVSIPSENPPGGELEVARFIEKTIAPEGFDVQLVAAKPGRENVIARLQRGGLLHE